MLVSELYVKLARLVRGKKTYLAVCGAGFVEVFYSFGYLSLEQRDALLKVCGSGAILALVAKLNRMAVELKTANNLTLRRNK